MRINKEAIIIGAVSIAFLAGMGYLIWKTPASLTPKGEVLAPEKAALLVKDTSHMTGTMGAKVTMVEFGDYQCPACAQAYPMIKQVVDKYAANPDFNFVFRNFPLPQHANAYISSEAAEAAGAQGKYWEMNEALYKGQKSWELVKDPTDIFVTYATEIGLDIAAFKADLAAEKYKSVITADLNDGNRIGVNQTPTIYINGQRVMKFSAAEMEKLIDAGLAAE